MIILQNKGVTQIISQIYIELESSNAIFYLPFCFYSWKNTPYKLLISLREHCIQPYIVSKNLVTIEETL